MQQPESPSAAVDGAGGPLRNTSHNNAERRSCSTCAVAKTRCVPRPYGPCERCHRLKKPCQQQEPAVRKPRGPAKKTSRKEQLEQKLDNIMSMLSQKQRDQLQGLSPPDTDSHTSPDTQHSTNMSETSFEAPEPSKICQERIPLTDTPDDEDGLLLPDRSKFLALQPAPPPQGLYISDEEAEIFLQEFKSSLAPHFPFIVIQDDVTPAMLRANKPFLYRTVIMASLYCDYPRQYYHVQENIRYFSERLLIKGEKTLDLLQGLLVLAAWYHVQHFMNPQLTNFCSLATALVIDLGLNRSPLQKEPKFTTFATQLAHGNQTHPEQQTTEERRALLGCYYLTSLFSACFKRLDGLPFTAHLEAACSSLEQAREYPSDQHLVAIVRCQSIIDKLRQPRESVQSGEGLGCPVTMYVRAFKHELKALGDGLPEVVRNNLSIRLMCASAEVQLYESALQEPFQYKGVWSIKKLEIQYHCCLALKTLFDTFTSFPIAQLYHMTFSTFAQLAYGMSILSRLQFMDKQNSALQDETSPTVDLVEVLDRSATQLDAAVHGTRFRGKPINNDKFLHWSACLRRFKDVYKRRTDQMALESAGGVPSYAAPGAATPKSSGAFANDPTLSEPMDPGLMEFFADDKFWSSMMNEAWNGDYYNMQPMGGPGMGGG